MNKKIVGIFIFTLLVGITLNSVGMNNKQINEETEINYDDYRNDDYRYDVCCNNNNGFLNPPVMNIDFENLNVEPRTYWPVLIDLPEYFNWMDHEGQDWTTNAKHQSIPKGCGSCWAFAALGALESVINIREGIADLNPDLSEQYILSCLPFSGNCDGGDVAMAYKVIMSNKSYGNYVNGVIPESCFPYQADDSISCEEKNSDWEEYIIPILDYGNLLWDINTLKSIIMENGPVVCYMCANENFSYWGFTNHNPEDYFPYEYIDSLYDLNHAIVIVGWKDDPSIGKGGYLICKNSWGPTFGYDGFFNMEYESLGTHYLGITWVNYDPESYDWHPTPKTNGPYYGMINNPIDFNGEAGGENPPFTYYWDFGDESNSEEQNPTHTYASKGKHEVTLTVTDDQGNSFYDKTYAWIQETNSPPNTPIIDGPSEIVKDEYCWYNISYSDPDGSPIYVREIVFEWDDGGWWGPYESGDQWERNWYWNWTEEGNYIVKAKTRDIYGAESDWAILEVTVPKNKAISTQFFLQRLVHRFPLFEKILDQLV